MHPLNVFSRLTKADEYIGFYTRETKADIPDSPGCYAWFLPLWYYSDNLDQLVRLVVDVLNYAPQPELDVDAPFVWQTINLKVRRDVPIQITNDHRAMWSRILQHTTARHELLATLMRATLFLPPLYVGRAEDLRARYKRHTSAYPSGNNTFAVRLYERAASLEVGVSDLLFVAVKTPSTLNSVSNDTKALTSLIERMFMLFCRPPFSLR